MTYILGLEQKEKCTLTYKIKARERKTTDLRHSKYIENENAKALTWWRDLEHEGVAFLQTLNETHESERNLGEDNN